MIDLPDANSQNPGTQTPLAPEDIGPPDYPMLPQYIDETIDCLLDNAIRIGERVSQGNIANNGKPAPFAHRACTSYHAIEIIRYLQQELADLQERYDTVLSELNGENS